MSAPTLNWNWRSASTKGMLSISPTVPPSCSTYLHERLNRRCSSEVAYLYNANIRWLFRVVDWNLRDPFNPILDSVRDVRNDLYGLAEIVAASLDSLTFQQNAELS